MVLPHITPSQPITFFSLFAQQLVLFDIYTWTFEGRGEKRREGAAAAADGRGWGDDADMRNIPTISRIVSHSVIAKGNERHRSRRTERGGG